MLSYIKVRICESPESAYLVRVSLCSLGGVLIDICVRNFDILTPP